MKKTLSMLLAGAMLAAALTGCGSSTSTGSDNADSSTDSSASGAAFKLGGTGPLTGANAIYGNAWAWTLVHALVIYCAFYQPKLENGEEKPPKLP